jgi:hypothetical protein
MGTWSSAKRGFQVMFKWLHETLIEPDRVQAGTRASATMDDKKVTSTSIL